MNSELENSRAVTSFRCTSVMRVRTGGVIACTVELNRVTFEDVLLDDVVVRLVDREDQCNDTVTTISGTECVTIDACLGIGVTLELIACTLAHRVTDSVEYLVINVDLYTVEHLLTIDGRIVAIETSGVVALLFTAPSVVPDDRQVIVADVDDGIYKRMNSELENSRAVTSFRCTSVMRVRTGGVIACTVELNRVTFEDVLLDDVVVRLVDREDQCNDTVTTISGTECVTIDACLGIGVTLELIACTLAHRVTDSVEYLVINVDLYTVEHLLTIDGRIVAIETSGVVALLFTAPSVVPDDRQVIVADVDDGIYKRMNSELENSRAVTSFRCTSVMRVRTGGVIACTVELNRVTFEDVLLDDVVVRLVDREDQCNDTVTTISGTECVTIDACLGIGVTLELIACTLAHRVTNCVLNRIVYDELQSVVHRFAIYHRGVIAVKACCVEESLLTIPLVDPAVRQIIRADYYGGVNQRMHDDTYIGDAVTTGRSQSPERS